MASAGRNDPCPCGSGKKFKRCCGASGAAPDRMDVAAALHAMDGRLVPRILRLGRTSFAEEFDALLDDCPCDPEDDTQAQIVGPYMAYLARIGEGTLVEAFLEREGRRLDPREKDWLEANRHAWLSAWEVVEVFPDRGFHLRDLLTGEERGVTERMGTQGIRPRMALCARVVDADGVSVLVGSHPFPLGPLEAAAVVEEVRRLVGVEDGHVPVERLRGDAVNDLLGLWQDTVDVLVSRPLPGLQNTDGDPLEDIADRFALAAGSRNAIEAALAKIQGWEISELPSEPEKATVFRIMRRGTSKPGGIENLSLGTAEVDPKWLVVRSNSERRANVLRSSIEAACGALATHEGREQRDMQDLLASSLGRTPPPGEPAGLPPEVAGDFIVEFKRRHYAAWPDEPVPALGGLTPREAAKRPDKRRVLVALLKDFEMTEAGLPEGQRYDVSELRRDLGIDE